MSTTSTATIRTQTTSPRVQAAAFTPLATPGYLTASPPLVPRQEARIAYRRFGLGYAASMPAGFWRNSGEAYQAILNEIERPDLALVPDVAMNVSDDSRGNLTGRLNLNGVPTAEQCGHSLRGETHLAWLQGDLRARYRMGQKPVIGFVERLVMFWSNHFSVCWTKSIVTRGSTGHLERTAIRPHVLGKFPDMLQAVISHPAMISYLDNTMNIGPNSAWGGDSPEAAAARHINENLAREVLELHTVGKEANYSQADVDSLAYLLTGYQIGFDGMGHWYNGAHERGDFTLLGTLYKQTYEGYAVGAPLPGYIGARTAQAMMDDRQVKAALNDLALNPFTARRLARKLIMHFLTDAPDERDVDQLAAAYLNGGGDLKAMSIELLNLPLGWSMKAPRRIRTPQLTLVAMNRALGLTNDQINAVSSQNTAMNGPFEYYLGALSHGVWERITPDGYPDNHAYWFNDCAMRLRMDITYEYLNKVVKALSVPGGVTYALPNPDDLADGLARLGAIGNVTRDLVKNTQADAAAKLTLLFMSSEFLRR